MNRISSKRRELIQHYEDCKLEAYQDSVWFGQSVMEASFTLMYSP